MIYMKNFTYKTKQVYYYMYMKCQFEGVICGKDIKNIKTTGSSKCTHGTYYIYVNLRCEGCGGSGFSPLNTKRCVAHRKCRGTGYIKMEESIICPLCDNSSISSLSEYDSVFDRINSDENRNSGTDNSDGL